MRPEATNVYRAGEEERNEEVASEHLRCRQRRPFFARWRVLTQKKRARAARVREGALFQVRVRVRVSPVTAGIRALKILVDQALRHYSMRT